MSGPEESIAQSSSTSTGYSADVLLWLRLSDRAVPLAQIGPDRIILKDVESVPAGAAELVLSVDGRERRWSVDVGQCDPNSRTVPIRLLDETVAIQRVP